MGQPITVPTGKKIRLKDFDSDYTGKLKKKSQSLAALGKNVEILSDLGYRLYAENRRSLLLILQGMDTSGKDGTIRHVMRGFNPQSCQVTSFKQPSIEELDHDFLWRIARAVPRRGNIGIFNRSQYEDVLVVRVHNLVPKKEWKSRYERINLFEKTLVEGGTTLVKVFLHISKQEQLRRLQKRLDDPKKLWKFSKADLSERKFWDQYQKAYEDALTKCNTAYAPWYIVPADKKWYRNVIVSRLLCKALKKMNPQYPPAEEGLEGITLE